MSTPKLLQPIKVGTSNLQHRVVLAPLTRLRSSRKEHVPTLPLMETYYGQRSSRPGSLLVSEATLIRPEAGGLDNAPGIWSQDQIEAWKKASELYFEITVSLSNPPLWITDRVHANGSFIHLQLWALGRAATPKTLREDGYELVAPSPIAISAKDETPRELTKPEIQQYIQWYAQAARNAMEAGFDGVEVHCANGYLLDQFLQDVSNQRTDEYGGSVEARSKFPLEAIDAVVKAIGEERTGLRISPFNSFQGMKIEDPVPQFSHFIGALAASHPNMAYLHTVEPDSGIETESSDFLREIWWPRPLIACGGFRSAGSFTTQSAIERAERTGDLIAFGRWYISNPDLPTRIEKNIPLTAFNRKTFYTPAHVEGTEIGYIDYPFADSEYTDEAGYAECSSAHL